MGNSSSSSFTTRVEAVSLSPTGNEMKGNIGIPTSPTTVETKPKFLLPPLPPSDGPPQPAHRETFEEKLFRKCTKHPLVPLGCIATAYFLASGINSFRNRDPVKSQMMMRNRVAAQLFTLLAFVGYMGIEMFDFRVAPFYQDAKQKQAITVTGSSGASSANNASNVVAIGATNGQRRSE